MRRGPRRAAPLASILVAAWLPAVPLPPLPAFPFPALAAQNSRDIARLTGETGVDPEPGTLLATIARLSIEQATLSEALVRLAESSKIQIAFSASLLPAGHSVDCRCATENVARALDRLLAGTDLGYVELGSQVIIVPRGPRSALPADARIGGQGVAVPVAAGHPDAESGGQATGPRAYADETARPYLDETARRLMEGARAARDSALAEIESYTAIVRERQSFEFSVRLRDRPLYRRESVTRVRWSRNGPTLLRVLASRLEVGGQRFKSSQPEGIAGRFAADPLRDPFSLFVDAGFRVNDEQTWFVPTVTPLDEDAERFYQFRSGDTITVRFAGGSVRAVSVTAHPRLQHLGLVFAVMWIEPETFGVVRTIYRPAKPIDSEWSLRHKIDGFLWNPESVYQAAPLGDVDVPATPRRGLLSRALDYAANAILDTNGTRMEIGFPVAVVDYTMWNLRHWLPTRASFATYAVAGDELDAEGSELMVTAQGLHDWDFEIEEMSTGGGDVPDSEPATEALVAAWREQEDTVEIKDGSEPGSGTVVIAPRDWRTLAASNLLPPSIWEERDSGIYASVIDEAGVLLDSIGFAPPPATREGAEAEVDDGISPWYFEPPILAPRHIRYNPVEGLSVGTRMLRTFPWGRGALTVRTATRRSEPFADLTAEYGRSGPRLRFSVYHALRQNSGTTAGQRLERLVTIADSSRYYVARGAAIQILPARSERFWMALRLFAETNTTLVGDARRRAGVDMYLRPWWGGLTGRRVSGGADVSLRGLVGDFPNVRGSVTGRLVIPLRAGLTTALEAGGARIWGSPAPEEIWGLGDSGDWLRGYPRVVLRGRQVWRSRVELQRQLSLFTYSVFHDWATADGRSLQSTGAGVSVFDGFLRLDLAIPLSPWYEEGTPVPGSARAGIDWAHQPKWRWHLRAAAPF